MLDTSIYFTTIIKAQPGEELCPLPSLQFFPLFKYKSSHFENKGNSKISFQDWLELVEIKNFSNSCK